MANYRQIRYFQTDNHPDERMIQSFITETYNSVPSKQCLMPYAIHVFGPKHVNEKEELFKATQSRDVDVNPLINYQIFASYVLLFTSRWCNTPNDWVKILIDHGHEFLTCDPEKYQDDRKGPSIEIGMFCSQLTNLCLNANLDVAYTACLPKRVLDIDEDVYLAMSIGYADNDRYKNNPKQYKPKIDEVIYWP